MPIISSYVVGPLGLLHLPRLWLKALLHAKDILAEDWGCGPGGLDKRIMDFVGIDGNAFVPWLMQTLPTYDQTEAWVRQNASNLNAASIARSNERLRTHGLPRDLGPQFRAYLGIDDESVVGIMLNNYDDWHTLHQYVMANEGKLEQIVPAISPSTVGSLGVPQLPRLWLKNILALTGALPDRYQRIREEADELALSAIGITSATTHAYVMRERPTYIEFESFIGANARQSPKDVAWEQIPGLNGQAVDAVHRYDWQLLHKQITEHADPHRPESTAPTGIYAFNVSGRLRS